MPRARVMRTVCPWVTFRAHDTDKGTANSHYPTPRPGADGSRMFDVAIGFRF